MEVSAGMGACPACRLETRHTWLDTSRPRPKPKDPSLLATRLCEACGAPERAELSRFPEDHREILRLCFTASLEDMYTNQRAWAAFRWGQYMTEAGQWRRKALRGVKKLTGPALSPREEARADRDWRQRRREREKALKSDPDVRLYQRLRAEQLALSERLIRPLERKYGVQPFPELEARLEGVEGPDYDRLYKNEPYARDVTFSPLFEIEQEAKMWLACAEAERVVLGGITATTVGKLAGCERLARVVFAAARATYEEREEECQREEAER